MGMSLRRPIVQNVRAPDCHTGSQLEERLTVGQAWAGRARKHSTLYLAQRVCTGKGHLVVALPDQPDRGA